MIGALSALGAGLLFGFGLWVSGMAMPRKVLDFLDVTGNWDPSLLLVMGGAVGVTSIFFTLTLKRQRPLLAEKFSLPTAKDVDLPLVLGSAIFGIGWGIGGYCPGPALTALSNLTLEPFVFVGTMVVGGLLARVATDRRQLSKT